MTPEEKLQQKIQPVPMTGFEFFIIGLQLLFIHWKVTGIIAWSWGWVLLPFIILLAIVIGMVLTAVVFSNIPESDT